MVKNSNSQKSSFKNINGGNTRALYVVSHLVQPMDVLLSRGVQKNSSIISKLTNGLFSHAALFLWDCTMLESLSDGIGMSQLPISRIEKRQKRDVNLRKLSDVDFAVVLRHPKLQGYSHGHLRDLVDEAIDFFVPFLGKRYPAFYKLATALPKNHPLKLFAQTFQKQLIKTIPPKEIEGPFCSQLVASVFKELKLDLFPKQKILLNPIEISPNRLFQSELKEVKKAVINSNSLQDGQLAKVKLLNKHLGYYPIRKKKMEGDRKMQESMKKLKTE